MDLNLDAAISGATRFGVVGGKRQTSPKTDSHHIRGQHGRFEIACLRRGGSRTEDEGGAITPTPLESADGTGCAAAHTKGRLGVSSASRETAVAGRLRPGNESSTRRSIISVPGREKKQGEGRDVISRLPR